MNNSQQLGIIICGPQGCGKTTFINELLKNNKFANMSVPYDKTSHASILKFYDLDALVFTECNKKMIKELAKMPNLAKIRLPYGIEERWLQRPLFLVETNIEFEPSSSWEVIKIQPSESSASIDYQYARAAEKIFQFILSKTK